MCGVEEFVEHSRSKTGRHLTEQSFYTSGLSDFCCMMGQLHSKIIQDICYEFAFYLFIYLDKIYIRRPYIGRDHNIEL